MLHLPVIQVSASGSHTDISTSLTPLKECQNILLEGFVAEDVHFHGNDKDTDFEEYQHLEEHALDGAQQILICLFSLMAFAS